LILKSLASVLISKKKTAKLQPLLNLLVWSRLHFHSPIK
jgi:hypothetical protein